MSNTNKGDGAPAADAAATPPTGDAAAVAAAAAQAQANAADHATALATAVATANTNAAAIIDMCAAVGKQAMAAGFIKDGLTPDQAKSKLFDELAKSAPPVDTSIADAANAGTDEGVALMVAAAKKLIKGA